MPVPATKRIMPAMTDSSRLAIIIRIAACNTGEMRAKGVVTKRKSAIGFSTLHNKQRHGTETRAQGGRHIVFLTGLKPQKIESVQHFIYWRKTGAKIRPAQRESRLNVAQTAGAVKQPYKVRAALGNVDLH